MALRTGLALALLLGLAGCRDDFFDPTPGQTVPQQQRVELIAENVRILPGEANAVRIGFRPKDSAVNLRVERSSSAGRIIACPLRSIDDPLPAQASCLPDLPDGVREGLTLTGLGAIVLVREGDPVTLGIRMEFEESSRELVLRLPVIERPAGASVCRDNACNPFFEVLPARGGSLTTTATWTGGPARLEILEGRVLARSFSSTGIPYRVAGQRTGPPPLSVTATVTSPGEYALALVNVSTGGLTGIEIRARWP